MLSLPRRMRLGMNCPFSRRLDQFRFLSHICIRFDQLRHARPVMHCLLLTTFVALGAGQTPALDNLDFRKGTLEGWDGQGFVMTGGSMGQDFAVTSADDGSPTRKGMIRHVVTIPPGISKIRFQAYAAPAEGKIADHRLDVLLAGAGNRLVPKMVRTGAGWRPAT